MQSITFGERLATAFVSIAATAITLFVLPLIVSVIVHNGKPMLMFGWIFSKLGILTLFLSAIAGFSLGADRMANVFSFFWGTHTIWEEEWFQKVFIGIFVLLVIGLLVHFALK
jgi:uncharacterized membrane protein